MPRPGPDEPVYANEVGAPLRQALFRSRIWRPSLVRAGLLGEVAAVLSGFEARWTDDTGASSTDRHRTHAQAVQHVAQQQSAGLRFHDLRHSLRDVARQRRDPAEHGAARLGHERSTTTLDLYTRRTDNSSRILDALDDRDEVPDDEDPDDGPEPVCAPG